MEAEGRVEICFNNSYGAICDRNFDKLDAEVACRALQFSTESKSITPVKAQLVHGTQLDVTTLHQASLNQAVGPVYLSDLRCNGQESSLLDCDHDFDTCEDAAVAAIKCTGICV